MLNSTKYLTLVVLLTSALGACTRGMKPTDGKQGSSLAAVGVTVPTIADMQVAYGQSCEKINFDKNNDLIKRLSENTKNNCDVLMKMLTTFRLNIKPDSCDANVTGTIVDNKTSPVTDKLSEQIRRNCVYSVLLDLGQGGEYYLSNQGKQIGNLTKDKLEKDPVALSLRLYPTAAAIKLGFPAQGLDATGDTNLQIGIKIGDQQGSNALPGAPSNNSRPVAPSSDFMMPLGWMGDSFKGDATWNLGKLN